MYGIYFRMLAETLVNTKDTTRLSRESYAAGIFSIIEWPVTPQEVNLETSLYGYILLVVTGT